MSKRDCRKRWTHPEERLRNLGESLRETECMRTGELKGDDESDGCHLGGGDGWGGWMDGTGGWVRKGEKGRESQDVGRGDTEREGDASRGG